MRAAYGGSVDIMSALIDHGANVNKQDVSLCRQLHRKMFQFGMLLGHSLLLLFLRFIGVYVIIHPLDCAPLLWGL